MDMGTIDRTALAQRLALQARRLDQLADALTERSRRLPRAGGEGWRGPAHAAFELELAAFEREVGRVVDRVRAAQTATSHALSIVSSHG